MNEFNDICSLFRSFTTSSTRGRRDERSTFVFFRPRTFFPPPPLLFPCWFTSRKLLIVAPVMSSPMRPCMVTPCVVFPGFGMGKARVFFAFLRPPETVSPAVSRFTYNAPTAIPSLSPHLRQNRASVS